MHTDKNKEKKLDITKLEKELLECQKLKDEYLAGWQRARADFLNYKKEESERVGGLTEYVAGEFAVRLLPILDNFEQAIEKETFKEERGEEDKRILEGFSNIKKQLQSFLKTYGLEEIETLGKKVDLRYHEVVEEIDSKDKESGVILEEVERGYILRGRVFRPAKVKIIK